MTLILPQIGGWHNSVPEVWSLQRAVYSADTFDASAQVGSFGQNIYLKPDKTKMYLDGFSPRGFFQYTLSTAGDITTATYDGVSFNYGSQNSTIRATTLSDDGLHVYGYADNETVYQYDLSTEWDFSTISYSGKSYNASAQDNIARGIDLSPDGTKMYLDGTGNDRVHQYTLSTAGDVSTASYDSKQSPVFSFASFGIRLKPDGLRAIIIESGTSLEQYEITNAWDISTADSAPSRTFSLTSPSVTGFYVDTTADNIFTIGSGTVKRISIT